MFLLIILLNTDGEICTSVRGYWNDLEISFPVLQGNDGVDPSVVNNLESGDVILFKQDNKDNLISIKEYPILNKYYSSRPSLYYSFTVAGGVVDEIDYTNKRIRLTYTDSGEQAAISYSSTTTVSVWNKVARSYKPIGLNDIFSGDNIFVNMYYLRCYYILIVK